MRVRIEWKMEKGLGGGGRVFFVFRTTSTFDTTHASTDDVETEHRSCEGLTRTSDAP